jgi:serine/threonine protein kinase
MPFTFTQLASEIRIHAMLKHKHIVKYVTFFEDSTSCYILMELCNNKVPPASQATALSRSHHDR